MTAPYAPEQLAFTDSAGIAWMINPETGRGVRVTPLPRSSPLRKRPETIKYFPPLKGPSEIAAPMPADVLFGFLLGVRPKTVSDTADLLAKEFPTTPRAIRDEATNRYAAAWLSPTPRPVTAPAPR